MDVLPDGPAQAGHDAESLWIPLRAGSAFRAQRILLDSEKPQVKRRTAAFTSAKEAVERGAAATASADQVRASLMICS
jgi:hypothetical protein